MRTSVQGRTMGLTCLAAAAVLMVGCGTVRETFPSRAATEQLLISTAADRAIAKVPASGFKDKKVFLEVGNLDSVDRPYVVQRIRRHVLQNGGKMADAAENADLVLEVASGGLSVDHKTYLIGLPSIPIPLPGAAVTLPELALFKTSWHTGKAKLLFTPIDPTDHEQAFRVPLCWGEAHTNYYWVLFTGPYETNDLTEGVN